ncbi:MAG: membrane protein [Chitinophagales bacterium]|nr:MAG: membrane protein [Chitinophagales bacterium]
MKTYKLLNNLLGWFVFVIALAVYTSTLEPTASFWDCGEFISGAYKLEVVHPPGAPFFLLLGRIFSLFAPGPEYVAYMVNFSSGLFSALGIMFLFWITTAFARKAVIGKSREPSIMQTLSVMLTGLIAALCCTFSDTYWFSAVEGEVYALSTFFIILVFWGIMKWEASEDERYRDRWIILIAFFLGLALGVHLMSLLAIPAMAMVYYFKKYNPTPKGTLAALAIGTALLFLVYLGIVSKFINILAGLDLFFVNTLNLPFGSGVAFGVVLLVAAIVGGLVYAHRKNLPNLQTALLSLSMIFIGFSLYSVVVIRALAIPPIDMNKPADIFRLQSYLNREQYGDRPLLYGPHFNAYPIEIVKKGKRYYKGEDKYLDIGYKVDYKFDDKDMMFFPRMGSWQDERHVEAYRAILGLKENQNPTMADNIRFFLHYQVGFMWFRYFMWNFSGRQDDIQGRFDNNNGKWISGFKFLDEPRIGPTDNLPDELKNNKGRNVFYMIPFLLGLIGMIYFYRHDKNDFLVVLTLFMFTGILEVIFFNSPPFEPRERDYTLVGSFVTYCIWIGFGALAIFDFLKSKLPASVALGATFLLSLTAPALMAKDGYDDHDRSGRYTARDFAINYLESCAPNAILFTQGDNDTYPLWYAQEVEGIRTDVRVVNLSLLGVDWYIEQLKYKINDADPVKLIHTPDKYLGNRRDVIRYFDNKRIPQDVPVELKNVIQFIASDERNSKVPLSNGEMVNYLPTKFMKVTVDSATVVKNKVIPESMYGQMKKELLIKINRNNLLKNDLMVLDIIASNLWERPIYFAVSVSPDSYLGFQNYFQLEGLAYRIVPLEKEDRFGQGGHVATDIMFDNMMNKFKWGGIELKDTIEYTIATGETKSSVAQKFNVTEDELTFANPQATFAPNEKIKVVLPNPLYLDENILRMTMNLRSNFARLIEALLEEGKKEQARAALDRCIAVMPWQTVPYNIFMVRFPEFCYRLDDQAKARALIRLLVKKYSQDLQYYPDVLDIDPGAKRSIQQAMAVFQELIRVARIYKDTETEQELSAQFASFKDI